MVREKGTHDQRENVATATTICGIPMTANAAAHHGAGPSARPLHLIGVQLISAPCDVLTEEQMAFYHRFFALAPRIVVPGAVTRYARFEARLAEDVQIRFIAVEDGSPAAALPGLTAWTLTDTRWRQSTVTQGERLTQCDTQISWVWRDDRSGHTCGDFRIASPSPADTCPTGPVSITANAYRDFHREYAGGDSVALVPYDPAWPDEFERFTAWLSANLGPAVIGRTEHIGSTAIPGMPAKPVIDVMAQVPDWEQARPAIIPRLNLPEWEYWWYDDHMMFIKRDGFMGRRTHHIHMAPSGSKLWERVAFRDYLRAHPGVASAYAALKTRLADAHEGDREEYTQAKGAFVRETTKRAMAWSGTSH